MVLAEVIGCCTSVPSSLVIGPDLLDRTAWVRIQVAESFKNGVAVLQMAHSERGREHIRSDHEIKISASIPETWT